MNEVKIKIILDKINRIEEETRKLRKYIEDLKNDGRIGKCRSLRIKNEFTR